MLDKALKYSSPINVRVVNSLLIIGTRKFITATPSINIIHWGRAMAQDWSLIRSPRLGRENFIQ